MYHIDGKGKEGGVVFCEMGGRNNSEDDIFARSLCSMMYPKTSYVYDSGGITTHISTLTVEEIRAYHAKYYHPDHCHLTLMGNFTDEEAFSSLEKVHFSLISQRPSTKKAWEHIRVDRPFSESYSKVINFPTEEDSEGTVYFAVIAFFKVEDTLIFEACSIFSTFA